MAVPLGDLHLPGRIDITGACPGCHPDETGEVHATVHWTWRQPDDPSGQLGEAAHTVNNFCIDVNSNWPRCTSCHVSCGWRDTGFDFGTPGVPSYRYRLCPLQNRMKRWATESPMEGWFSPRR